MRFLTTTCAAILAIATATLARAADPVTLKVGKGEQYESLQSAIDAAPDGAVLRLSPGDFTGPFHIEKPLRIEGAGWDKTRLVIPQAPGEDFDKALKQLLDTIRDSKGEFEAVQVMGTFTRKYRRDGVTIKFARGVELRDLSVAGAPAARRGPAALPSLVTLIGNAQAKFENCAILGSLGNGITSTEGCDLEVRHCLVAGLWGAGIAAAHTPNPGPGRGRLVVADSDLRNCCESCVTFDVADAVVERCRISGTGGNGIRIARPGGDALPRFYAATLHDIGFGAPDGEHAPRIEGNRFWHIAQVGIYTTGTAGVAIRGNLFDGIERGGVACWRGGDTIERNTFINNKSAAVSVGDDSHPTIRDNVFANHPLAVLAAKVSVDRPDNQAIANLKLNGNWFWQNTIDLGRNIGPKKIDPFSLPDDAQSTLADPGLADPANGDYTLTGPAKGKAGAAHPLPKESPFPLTEEELRIVPQGDNYDYPSWRNRPEVMR